MLRLSSICAAGSNAEQCGSMRYVSTKRGDSQRSMLERNNQVRLMGKIYSKASQVVVWLGPAVPTTARVIRRLKFACLAGNENGEGTMLRSFIEKSLNELHFKDMRIEERKQARSLT